MKEYRRIFFSYAASDAETAAIIAADLKIQGFEVWEYAREWKKEHLGYSIPEECAELIQRATWFVPVVSAASVSPSSGRYAVLEIEYASEIGLITQNRVVPVLLSASKPKQWFKPFDELEPVGAVKIDSRDQRVYLQGIAQLCRRMNVVYTPVVKDRTNLPFWNGFLNEVEQVRKKSDEAWRLMTLITEFDRCIDKKNWQHAYDLITYYNGSVDYIASSLRPVFSRMVQAHCELETGRFAAAEEHLLRAAQDLPDAPELLGVMGHLHLYRKENQQAREYLAGAIAQIESGDLRSRFYYLCPLIELGEPISEANRRLVLDSDLSSWPEAECTAVLNARAVLLHQSGSHKQVIALFEEAGKKGLHDTTTVIYTHLSYLKLGKPTEAETVLTAAIRESKSHGGIKAFGLYYYLAEYYLTTETVGKTLTIYEKHLLKPEVLTRRFAVRYARILKKLGDEKRMRTECLRMLGGQFPPPRCCEDFYFDGFANYLLGNTERAQYDFERSRQFDTHYSRTDEPAGR